MPTNGPKGIQIEISGDATPLERDIAEAKAKVENAKVSATGPASETAKVNREVSETYKDVSTSAATAATSVESVAAKSTQAATTTEKLSGTLNTAKVALNGVRAAFGAVTFVLGSLAAAYAIVTARSEENKRKVEEATREYGKYIESVRKLNAEFGKQSDDKVANRIADITDKYDEQLTQIYKLKLSDADYKQAVQQNLKDRADAEQRVYDEANARARGLQSQLAAARRIEALEDLKATQKREQSFMEDMEKRANAAEDFKQKMRDIADDVEQSARKAEQAWVNSLRQIREASNAAFNTDNARSMVELAGNLNQTATTATANMNRIIVGGTD